MCDVNEFNVICAENFEQCLHVWMQFKQTRYSVGQILAQEKSCNIVMVAAVAVVLAVLSNNSGGIGHWVMNCLRDK